MNNGEESSVLHKFLISAWGMATLVLLFSVVFLAYELMSDDRATVSSTGSGASRGALDAGDQAFRMRQSIRLYFADTQMLALVPELRPIELSDDTVTNCRAALEELIQGPRQLLAPVVSPSTRVRGLYLLDGGELVVDFSRDLEAGMVQSASSEWLMVQGIVSTLTQSDLQGEKGPTVRRVRFLFEGSPAQDRFPVHVGLAEPVAPDRSLFIGFQQGSSNA